MSSAVTFLKTFDFNKEQLGVINTIAPTLRMLRGNKKEISLVYSFPIKTCCQDIKNADLPALFLKDIEKLETEYSNYVKKQKSEPSIVIYKDEVGFALGKTMEETLYNYNGWVSGTSVGSFKEEGGLQKWLPSLYGKVCLVTGGAQGLGEGIADYLLSQGAYVVIADMNQELSEKTVTKLSEKYGFGCVVPVNINVADEASVEEAVQKVVAYYGGIDLLVSNAGVLRSGPIDELSLADFQFVTRVNYDGYFLSVKSVSKVMKKQHSINPDHWMDIIQINSKSGLAGSNKNSAYAGTKFAGIGLTQSFALELVTSSIKVNAICPGNNLDGPLWTDPDRGLFVQYLKAGKVPGAKTVEDVKESYMSKVPIHRGCYPTDLGIAIKYLVEQKYETGQALPVTGGQEMLK